MDTIYALASARGKAGVALVRLSGPRAHGVLIELGITIPLPRMASLRRLMWRGVLLDEAVVTIFEDGHSFTGEAVTELSLHGSTAVVQAVLRALAEMPGLRLAEPGEFTRRALENGRLDLTQVEGLADLIDAETEAQRRQSLRVVPRGRHRERHPRVSVDRRQRLPRDRLGADPDRRAGRRRAPRPRGC